MAEIKRYTILDEFSIEEDVIGDLVLYEDHRKLVEKLMKQAFQDGKKAGYGDGMYVRD